MLLTHLGVTGTYVHVMYKRSSDSND